MKTISTLILALGAIGFASAETVLYSPAKSLKDQQISVHRWGSGTIEETDEYAFEGTTSIRVSTNNLFSGGQIFFGGNPDLSKEFPDKNSLLQITFRVADNTSTSRSGAGKGPGAPSIGGAGSGPGASGKGGGPPGVPPLPGPGGGRGQGGRPQGPPPGVGGGPPGVGGPPGGFGPPGSGGPSLGGAGGGMKTVDTTTLKVLRLVISTTDGLKSEAYVPADI